MPELAHAIIITVCFACATALSIFGSVFHGAIFLAIGLSVLIVHMMFMFSANSRGER